MIRISRPRAVGTVAGPRWGSALLGICLLVMSLICLAQPSGRLAKGQRQVLLSVPTGLVRDSAPRTPSEEELWRARWLRTRALLTANDEGEALRDRSRYLGWARRAAKQAFGLAHTTDERYQTSVWLALIEHELGEHWSERLHVHAMIALRPSSREALAALRRVANCNGVRTSKIREPEGKVSRGKDSSNH